MGHQSVPFLLKAAPIYPTLKTRTLKRMGPGRVDLHEEDPCASVTQKYNRLMFLLIGLNEKQEELTIVILYLLMKLLMFYST